MPEPLVVGVPALSWFQLAGRLKLGALLKRREVVGHTQAARHAAGSHEWHITVPDAVNVLQNSAVSAVVEYFEPLATRISARDAVGVRPTRSSAGVTSGNRPGG